MQETLQGTWSLDLIWWITAGERGGYWWSDSLGAVHPPWSRAKAPRVEIGNHLFYGDIK